MYNKRLIFALAMVLVIVAAGVIAQTVSEITLENQAILALQGQCGECEGSQSCSWCDSWGTGSEKCEGGSYSECFDTEEEKTCGECATWDDCGRFYDCSSPGCNNCQDSGACEGCAWVVGGDSC